VTTGGCENRMHPITILMYCLSFLSLYLSIFWLSLLYIEEKTMKEKPEKIDYFPKVSVILPAHNQEKIIAKVLRSVLSLDYPKDKLEVIAVNDDSTDRTGKIIEEIRKKDKRLKVIHRHPGFVGKAAAVNEGLKIATGELIGVLDGDDPSTAKCALKLMVPYFKDKKLGAVMGAIKVWKPKKLIEKLQWFEYIFVTVMRRLLASLNALYVTPGGAFSLYRKSVLDKEGPFDESSLTEDLEMAMRLQHKGYKIKLEIDCVNHTKVPDTLQGFHRQRVRWYRGWLHTVYKYRDMILNRKYGFLGMVQIPVSIFLPILLIFVTIFIISSLIKWAYDWIILTGLGIYPEFSFFKEVFTTPNIIILTFTCTLILAGMYMLSRSQKILQENWRYPLIIMPYFTLYQLLLSSYWLVAASYEVLRIKKKW